MTLLSYIKKSLNLNWIIAITFISVTWINFNQERWISKNIIIQDVANYYSYLPALFYENDLHLSFLLDTVNQQVETKLYTPNYTPQNKPVIKMSMGMAISYLPFFALAHIYAKWFNYSVDGISEPYHFAIQFSTLFYYLLGLIFLWKVLRLYFSQQVSSITLLCITFGTNVFYYLTVGAGMAHGVDFALMAAFLFYTVHWHKDPTLKRAILLGCIGGFLILVRPINILVFIFFLFYDIKSFKEVPAKFNFLFSYKLQLFTVAFFAILVFLPQVIYWKSVSGDFLFNSYVGEHFYFNNPHVLKALFGFRKGWLIYTPIMLFSMIGFFLLHKKLKEFTIALPVFFMLYLYIAFSWWCWWYGGSFSQRVLIDIYPLLAIPFAALLTLTQQQSVKKRRLVYSALVFFILLNLFQSVQSKYNIIHYDSMTRQNYFQVFFTITKKSDREKYLVHPDYEKARRGEEENCY